MATSGSDGINLHSPSLFRLVAANLAGYFIAIFFILLLWFGSPYIFSFIIGIIDYFIPWNHLYNNDAKLATIVATILIVLALLSFGLVQWLLLRRWIGRWWLWLLVSAVGLVAVLYAGRVFNEGFIKYASRDSYDFYSNLRFSLINTYGNGDIGKVDVRLQYWTAVSGALIGLVCGLMFGMVQSLVMKQGRRRWWAITAAIWIFFGAGLALGYLVLSLS